MQKRARIAGLDGVRAIAILFVLFGHLNAFGAIRPPSGLGKSLISLFEAGNGVRIFFVLSGFLITTLLLNEKHDKGTISYRAFIARRTLRIFPAYFLFLGVVAVLNATTVINCSGEALAYATTYLSNFAPAAIFRGCKELSHTWSLAVEEQFYLLWPLAVRLLPIKGAIAVSLALIVLSPVARSFLEASDQLGANYSIGFWAPVSFNGVMTGSLCALLLAWQPTAAVLNQFSRSLRLLCIGLALYFGSAFFNSWLGHLRVPAQMFGVGLALIWITNNQTSRVTQLLSIRPLVLLGTISYGLYLWQGLFLRTGPSSHAPWFQSPPINVLLAITVAACSYTLVERRILAIKDRLFGSR